MFQIDLIRHGRTKGNEERRYVGRTDEGLSRRAGWNSVKYGSTWMARSAAETIWTVKSVRAHARMHCRMLCFKVPCAAVRRARISYSRVSHSL